MYLNNDSNNNIIDDIIKEKEFQDIIARNSDIKQGIIDAIFDEAGKDFSFDKETEYINGITADFTLLDVQENNIVSILECKRPDIGVTEYVRGIGQLLQYEYFLDTKELPKKYTNYSYKAIDRTDFKNALVIPSDFIKNTHLNIGKFKYPKSSIIIEVNLNNYNVRKITTTELRDLSSNAENTVSISQYYFRDNRIFEYYLVLQFILYWHSTHPNENLNRRVVEEQYLRKIGTINNGNWRNTFITISNLGFIDSKNKLTISGLKMTSLTLSEFTYTIYADYAKPYVDLLLKLFQENPLSLKMRNSQIVEELKKEYNGKDILYLTQSNARYVSSWLSVMRDDLQCLEYEPNSSNREIKYNINNYTESAIKNILSTNNIGQKYLDKYHELVKDGFH